MATPVVAGAAALLIQQHPDLTPDQVKARLMKTAIKNLNLYSLAIDARDNHQYNSQSDIFTVGAGYLNIAAALTNNDLVTLPALLRRSPATWSPGSLGLCAISASCGAIPSCGVMRHCSANVVFSRLATSPNSLSILWGDSVIWGDFTAAGYSVLWGDTVPGASALTALSADDDDL